MNNPTNTPTQTNSTTAEQKYLQFGFHLTIDLYGCPKEPLEDMRLGYDVLDKLPTKLGMHALIPPYIIWSEGNDIKDPGGFTGMIIIAESHISVHTFAKRGFVSIDVYSCKEFDQAAALKHFEEAFKPKESEVHYVDRGVKYPAEDLYT